MSKVMILTIFVVLFWFFVVRKFKGSGTTTGGHTHSGGSQSF
jgi:hypothetical protein